jgi:hypothetical protein
MNFLIKGVMSTAGTLALMLEVVHENKIGKIAILNMKIIDCGMKNPESNLKYRGSGYQGLDAG